jgi:hypothetical protein
MVVPVAPLPSLSLTQYSSDFACEGGADLREFSASVAARLQVLGRLRQYAVQRRESVHW